LIGYALGLEYRHQRVDHGRRTTQIRLYTFAACEILVHGEVDESGRPGPVVLRCGFGERGDETEVLVLLSQCDALVVVVEGLGGTSAEEVGDLAVRSLLEEVRYPSPDSSYRTQAAWNQDKLDNSRLMRNTPDFRMALRKLVARSGTSE